MTDQGRHGAGGVGRCVAVGGGQSIARTLPVGDRLAVGGSRARGGFTAFVIAISLVLASQDQACAQPLLNSVSLPFDIPAQSLAPALGAFSAASHLELYYESSLVEGHRSSAVSGSFSPDIALGRLLRGTGLSVESFVPGTATILPARPAAQAQDLAALKSKTVEFSSYFSRIQVSLRAAFCKSPALQADPSELIVRLWIASSGAIALAELRQPTGVEERDRAYVAAMRSLVVGQAPPPDMPQPVTIMVLPRTSRAAAQCPPADSAASGRVLVHE